MKLRGDDDADNERRRSDVVQPALSPGIPWRETQNCVRHPTADADWFNSGTEEQINVAKQKSPHTQSQQNVIPEQPDLEPGEDVAGSGTDEEAGIYENMAGAETGGTRSPRKVPGRPLNRSLAAPVAHEGAVTTRSPKGRKQGISSHVGDEESARQEKVVKKRPDAQAGLNRGGRKRA